MKIYTFKASSDTPVELLWPLRPNNRIGEVVLEHFDNNHRYLQEMKQKNRAVYNQFLAPDKFIPNFIKSILC